MKFRFCGDGDCPDWVLAEIHSSLSILTSIKLKLLTQLVVKSILGEQIPEEKLKETFAANKNDLKPIKSTISCIRFLLINAARYNTDDNTFSTELQQLGLPKEHSTAICRVFDENNAKIKEYLANTSFTANELVEMSHEIPKDTIDCASISFRLKNELVNGVPSETVHCINIGKTDIKMLLNEMNTVKALLEELK